ncbi:hypothetical protein D8B26_003801 [Coccidioides posadasii str. Silveira]|uniref:Zn(2)-C6 fungal-type domain-containing protein n=2 Tax=Coccidioides posadasii TaxID=199306 RepID=E9D8Y2_COCPS|nr:Fungal specific transcription factor, putative [Coccidioides posadasii C735 delta SOWgp]EER29628.1 Fungal specific transcription factor, putative [Coccidioides posadasii C735 delta SOWgp]EFW17016.1 conserved hypothetical protein [Coccidioides posadasii str. Silveira]QVM09135.1 hypothetical protein D8B26_003801 [Coccidioides posadasii str. Silveira]|eukprot:XP_003071773.1 Fungal specific transcription factor, putative [Coccidioides posadasii C735 delta SOWgp]
MTNPSGKQPNPVRPAPLACLECRRKHLKCDGGTPVCGRCRKAQSDCQYTPSRRGYKPSSKPPAPSTIGRTPRAEAPPQPAGTPIGPPQSPFLDPSLTIPGIPLSQSLDRMGLMSTDRISLDPDVFTIPDTSAYLQGDGLLFDYYYAFFHDAHPILPPSHLLHRLAPIPPCLQAVMRFIGAHYTLDPSADLYRESVVTELAAATEPSFYKVQALLLFSIVLHARDERADGVESFSAAVDLAFGMGMNRASFASTLGGDDPVRVETLRRTWWELYIVDGMFCAFDQMTSKINNSTLMDTLLPCDDLSYSAGIYLTESPSPTHFYDRVFADDDEDFSSFCYAVEAGRILKRTLDLGYAIDDYQLADQVESIDASIGSWFHHLPNSKRNILGPDGTVDQLLFRAHMIINCALIYLHLPRSNLLSTPTATASIPCARRSLCIAAASSTNLTHAIKSIKAANDLAALAALRSTVIKQTPFFICGLVLSAIVQLCACSVRASNCLQPRRDRIALIVGELKALNSTWVISRLVMKQIKLVAREVLEIGIQQPLFPELEDQGPDISSIISSDVWLGDIPIEQ